MRVKCEEILVMRLVGPVIKDLNYNNTNTAAIKVENFKTWSTYPMKTEVIFCKLFGHL